MTPFRIALANLRYPKDPEESITLAVDAIEDAHRRRVALVCFPECFVPGYRIGKSVPPPDAAFLDRAWSVIGAAAKEANLTVVLGSERLVGDRLFATAVVIQPNGSIAGFQDKVQLDPTEDATYSPGETRQMFQAGPLKFGVSICHEGFRYPETVRWAAQRGAHIVFHPHLSEAEPGSYRPTTFADPLNTFHEKTALCRAAENTFYFATVNYASLGSPTTSAIAGPDGNVLSYQPYGEEGLLVADLDLEASTRFLVSRLRNDSGQLISF